MESIFNDKYKSIRETLDFTININSENSNIMGEKINEIKKKKKDIWHAIEEVVNFMERKGLKFYLIRLFFDDLKM